MTTPQVATARIGTWNMSHAVKRDPRRREAAWDHLHSLALDIGLLQEAGGEQHAFESEVRSNGESGWTYSARVVTSEFPLTKDPLLVRPNWNPKLEFDLPHISRIGTVAVGLVESVFPEPLVAVSLYGRLRYADQSVLQAACDLIPLMDSPLGRYVVVGGDFNLHTHSNNARERARARPILDLFASMGLYDLVAITKEGGQLQQGDRAVSLPCPCADRPCPHVMTHRHPRARPGSMANNDYLFASRAMAERLVGVHVQNGDAEPAWQHSDHAPVIATFQVN